MKASPVKIGICRSNSFRALGHEVLEVDSDLEQTIVKTILDFNPRFVVVNKGIGLRNEDMAEIGKHTIMVYNYMDGVVRRRNLSMANFPLRFTEWQTLGNSELKAEILFASYDPETYFPLDVEKKYDVVFLGTAKFGNRRSFLTGVEVFSGVWNEEHNLITNQTRVNIHVNNKGGNGSDRIFKVMGSGGFLLCQYSDDIPKLFTIGEDLDVFHTKEEMDAKIKYYLENEEERERMALNGLNTVRTKYTRKQWAEVICKRVEEYEKENR
jgi:hypothetical protein